MKVTKFLGNRQVENVDIPEPQIERDTDVKINVKYCGICGSDVGAYAFPLMEVPSRLARGKAPYVQGHEFTGVIEAVGSAVTKFKVGDRVTAEPLIYCGECEECKKGNYNLCEEISCIGYAADGAFCEHIVVEERNVHLLPDDVDFKVGALVEPTGVAFGAVVDSGLKPNDVCLVFGAGTIGIMAMQSAKALGASKTIIVDIADDRLNLAKDMGADYTINSKNEDVVKRVMEITKVGADIIIEASGSQIALDNAILCARKHAHLQIVAMYHQPIEIRNQVAFMPRDIHLTMSTAAYNGKFDRILNMIANGELTPQKLISKEIELKDLIEEGIEKLLVDKSLIKIMVKCS
ncbi:MAG: zinc-binding dehydrogenase [Traorella sp.]